MTDRTDDRRFMSRALELAQRGLYVTRPNPRVGCVIVRDGIIVGEGATAPAGGPHAEAQALAAAGEQARGATLYVTLEPCNHHGRTPPCSEAIVAAGISRVVSAMEDPNPAVSGGGVARLVDAGIEVEQGLLQREALAVNPGFVSRCVRGRPLTRLKVAMSLDGRTAMASGESQWITGAAARRDVQLLRARSCALVTGVGTILDDDARLTVRTDELEDDLDSADRAFLEAQPPLRVVLDSTLRTPADARVLQGGGRVLLCAARQAFAEEDRAALEAVGAEVLTLPRDAAGVPLEEVLEELGRRECNEVLLECGPTLAGHALERGLVDELWLYMAPRLLGMTGRPLAALELDRLEDSIDLRVTSLKRIGADVRMVLEPR